MAKMTKVQARRAVLASMGKLTRVQEYMLFDSNINFTTNEIEKIRKCVLDLRKVYMKMK